MAHIHVNDLDTARRIADGEVRETEIFVTLHYAPLFRFMRQHTKHREDAEDLTQLAFIKAKQQIASYRGQASLRSWLYRVAFHEFTHWNRQRRTTQSLDTVPARSELAYEACIEAGALEDALGKLPQRLREAFLLHEVHELSVEETAGVLGLPEGTVKSRLFHARRKLHAALGGHKEDEYEKRSILES